MKYIKTKIIALPSERAKENGLCFNGDRFNTYLSSEAYYFNTGGELDWQPYDLYFLSDEQIQEGDYVIDDTGLFGPVENKDVLINPKKIIATTDESLKLPKPTNEFLKKYCELGGINEVLVEYEYEKEWVYYEEINESSQQYTNLKLKVAPDNTITIKPLITQK